MAQITMKTSRAPTVRVIPGDYTGIPLSLRRRLSLRLILGGIDVTPKPLVHETQLSEDVQEALQTSPTAPRISEISGTTSSLTESTPLEPTSIQEPFTESEMKNFVLFDESAISGVSAEIPPLPSNLCYLLQPQEPGIPEYPPPCSDIVITLRETVTVFLLNLPPLNVDVKTEESKEVESDNEYYEYITVGKGCHRNTKMAEVQTEYSVRKTRSTMALTVGVKDSCSSANAWDLENVEFKHIQGASPELVLLDMHDKELERIDLAPLSRQDCNDLLIKRGFLRKKADSEMHPNLQHEDF